MKLEFEAFRKCITYRFTIARLEDRGSTLFEWSPRPGEASYIILSDETTLRPVRLLELLKEGPLFAGTAWRDLEKAKIELVLEKRLNRDVIDEAEISVEPFTG